MYWLFPFGCPLYQSKFHGPSVGVPGRVTCAAKISPVYGCGGRDYFLRQDEMQLKFAAANCCFTGKRGPNDAQHTHPPITFRWVLECAIVACLPGVINIFDTSIHLSDVIVCYNPPAWS